MQRDGCKTHHETMTVDGLDVFYRHAGERDKPSLLMLHGFPTSSHMYRKLIAGRNHGLQS